MKIFQKNVFLVFLSVIFALQPLCNASFPNGKRENRDTQRPQKYIRNLSIFNGDFDLEIDKPNNPVPTAAALAISNNDNPILISGTILYGLYSFCNTQKFIKFKSNISKLANNKIESIINVFSNIKINGINSLQKKLNIGINEFLPTLLAYLSEDIFNENLWTLYKVRDPKSKIEKNIYEKNIYFLAIPNSFLSNKEFVKNSFNFNNLKQISFKKISQDYETLISTFNTKRGKKILNSAIKNYSELSVQAIKKCFKKSYNNIYYNIFMVGHGIQTEINNQNARENIDLNQYDNITSNNGRIADLKLKDFRDLLVFFNNKINTNCFVYESCYASGWHSIITYKDLILNYDVICLNFGHMPVLATLNTEINKFKNPTNIISLLISCLVNGTKETLSKKYNISTLFENLTSNNYEKAFKNFKNFDFSDTKNLHKTLTQLPIIREKYSEKFKLLNIFDLKNNVFLLNQTEYTSLDFSKNPTPIFVSTQPLDSYHIINNLSVNNNLVDYLQKSFLYHIKKESHSYKEIPYDQIFIINNLNTSDYKNTKIYVHNREDKNRTCFYIKLNNGQFFHIKDRILQDQETKFNIASAISRIDNTFFENKKANISKKIKAARKKTLKEKLQSKLEFYITATPETYFEHIQTKLLIKQEKIDNIYTSLNLQNCFY